MKVKEMFVVIFSLFLIGWAVPSYAGNSGMKITMPDGSVVPLDGLDTNEIRQMSELAEKVAKAKAKSEASKAMEKAGQIATDAITDPEKLESWRKLITGTIKDVCSDLNVTVNEFIKTPAGMGATALIIYKVAGKDLLERVFRVMFIIPFWFIVMGILFYLRKKYLSVITIYKKKEEIAEEGSKKIVTKYSEPESVTSYPWHSKYQGDASEARTVFAVILFIIGIVITAVSIMIALI